MNRHLEGWRPHSQPLDYWPHAAPEEGRTPAERVPFDISFTTANHQYELIIRDFS